MEVGRRGAAAAAASSILGIPGILRAAAETREVLVALKSLAKEIQGASNAARVLLEATRRLQKTVDIVCNLMRQLRAGSKKRVIQQQPAANGAVANEACIRALYDDPSLLAALEKHMEICVSDISLAVRTLRSHMGAQSRGLKQPWKEARSALGSICYELAERTMSRGQSLARHLITLGCHVDLSPSVSSSSSCNSAQGRIHDANDYCISKHGPSTTTTTTPEATTEMNSDTKANQSGSIHSDCRSTNTVATANASLSGPKGALPPQKGDLSRKLGQLGLGKAVEKSGALANGCGPTGGAYFSCGALSGIDDGAEELEDGSLGCRFCGIRFVHDDEMTTYRVGAHLVRAHAFALCNLNCTFDSGDEFLHHLKSFHSWSRTEPAMVSRLFGRSRAPPDDVPAAHHSSRLVGLENGHAQPCPALRDERVESGLLQLQVLNAILLAADLNICMHPEKPDPPPPPPVEGSAAPDPGQTPMAHNLCQALSSLDKLALADPSTAGSGSSTPVLPKAVNGCGAKLRKLTTVGVEDLMYHAACVQQEMAITSAVGDDDVFRHEALYAAEQYKLDDLVCMYFPPRTSPPTERHRLWHVRTATDEGGDRNAKMRAHRLRQIEGLGIKRVEASRPLRSFRDAVRVLGRAHMDQSGETGYISVMPQVLEAAGLLLWQEGRSPEASKPGTYVPLSEENLKMYTQLQQRESQVLANTPVQRRARWVATERLDWWFLGMLERSASFRRLVKSGKAFPAPTTQPPMTINSSKGRKSKPLRESPTLDAAKNRLLPYKWATILLSSAGLPQGRNANGKITPRVAAGTTKNFGRALGTASASSDALTLDQPNHHHHHHHPRNHTNPPSHSPHQAGNNNNRASQTPAVSMVGADYGTCSTISVEEHETKPSIDQEAAATREQPEDRGDEVNRQEAHLLAYNEMRCRGPVENDQNGEACDDEEDDDEDEDDVDDFEDQEDTEDEEAVEDSSDSLSTSSE